MLETAVRKIHSVVSCECKIRMLRSPGLACSVNPPWYLREEDSCSETEKKEFDSID